MANICAITGKKYRKVTKRSHSMRGTITRLKANLQYIKVGNKRVKVSANAIKTMKKYPHRSFPLLITN